MATPQVACHLIVFRGRQDEDLVGVLQEVQAAGFAGVEGGQLAGGDGATAGRILRDHGFVQCSLSTGFHDIERLDDSIAYAQAVGGSFVMVSGVGDHERDGIRAYETAAETFNRAGERCNAAGLTFCYHNHSWEFEEYNGITGLERLYELTDPALVKACIDVFWVRHGGRDPVSFLERYRDRIGYVHLKDLQYLGAEPRPAGVLSRDDAEFVELGRGEVDFPGIWEVLRPLDLPWLVYEQDRSALPPGKAAAVSRRYLRERLGL